jgi:hypothetical protein
MFSVIWSSNKINKTTELTWTNNRAYVKINNEHTEQFTVQSGVKQILYLQLYSL